MPAKKAVLTDEERLRRVRETARELGVDDDPKVLDKALKKIAARKQKPAQRGT